MAKFARAHFRNGSWQGFEGDTCRIHVWIISCRYSMFFHRHFRWHSDQHNFFQQNCTEHSVSHTSHKLPLSTESFPFFSTVRVYPIFYAKLIIFTFFLNCSIGYLFSRLHLIFNKFSYIWNKKEHSIQCNFAGRKRILSSCTVQCRLHVVITISFLHKKYSLFIHRTYILLGFASSMMLQKKKKKKKQRSTTTLDKKKEERKKKKGTSPPFFFSTSSHTYSQSAWTSAKAEHAEVKPECARHPRDRYRSTFNSTDQLQTGLK